MARFVPNTLNDEAKLRSDDVGEEGHLGLCPLHNEGTRTVPLFGIEVGRESMGDSTLPPILTAAEITEKSASRIQCYPLLSGFYFGGERGISTVAASYFSLIKNLKYVLNPVIHLDYAVDVHMLSIH